MRVQMKNILCATDFSDFSNHTIPYGVALAGEFDAKLYICHVIDLSSIAIYGEFQLNPVDQQNRIRKQAAEQLDEIIGEQPGVSCIKRKLVWVILSGNRAIVIGEGNASQRKIPERRAYHLQVIDPVIAGKIRQVYIGNEAPEPWCIGNGKAAVAFDKGIF